MNSYNKFVDVNATVKTQLIEAMDLRQRITYRHLNESPSSTEELKLRREGAERELRDEIVKILSDTIKIDEPAPGTLEAHLHLPYVRDSAVHNLELQVKDLSYELQVVEKINMQIGKLLVYERLPLHRKALVQLEYLIYKLQSHWR